MGEQEISEFLSHLAVEKNVSALAAPSREPYYVGERYSHVVCTLP
jgi:hypothetical protein